MRTSESKGHQQLNDSSAQLNSKFANRTRGQGCANFGFGALAMVFRSPHRSCRASKACGEYVLSRQPHTGNRTKSRVETTRESSYLPRHEVRDRGGRALFNIYAQYSAGTRLTRGSKGSAMTQKILLPISTALVWAGVVSGYAVAQEWATKEEAQ